MDHPRAWATIPCALFLFALVLLTVSTGTIAQVTESKQSQLQLEDFFQSPSSHQVTLSPDGTKIAWIYATDSSSVRQLKVLDIASQSVKKVLASPNILRPIWHKTSDSLFVVTQTAMLLISIEEQRARKTLLRFDRNLNQRFFKYDTAEDVVYFSEEDERSHRIFSLSQGIDKGKKLLLESQQRIQNLFHFPDHNALFYTLEFNDHLEIMAKEQENTRSLRSCDMVIRCNLLGVNLDERILFIDSNAQSRIDSVSSLHLDTLTETILMVDPEGVSDREFTKIANGQLLYTSFFGDFRHFYSQQQHIQQAFDHLSEMFPEKNLSLQFSTDLSSWLVQVTAGNMQLPRYFVFSPTDAELTELTTNIELKRPKINEARLTKATPVTYKARDGLPIQSYVWLPKNVDLKNAPIVASIHGGPWKRLKGEYDLITQAMVDNGYIVFQPNFRASWGYGVDFIKAGAKTFGKGDTHNDIIDGIEYLLANGIGHRDKLAIQGHSFGGFSVLGALAFEPDYFKAGFASAPPAQMISFNSDNVLKKMGRKRQKRGFDRIHQDRVFLFDERNPQEVEYIRTISPEAHKMAIKAPLIIAAGGRDVKVPVAGVKRYAMSLKRAGKPVSFFIEKNAPHSFRWDPTWSSLVYSMERFFAQHLGGKVHPANDDKYRQHLKKMEAFSTEEVSKIYR